MWYFVKMFGNLQDIHPESGQTYRQLHLPEMKFDIELRCHTGGYNLAL